MLSPTSGSAEPDPTLASRTRPSSEGLERGEPEPAAERTVNGVNGALERDSHAGAPRQSSFRQVPVATILTAIGLVLATLATLWLVQHLTRILTWMAVALFFAIVLTGPVNFCQRRLRLRRGLAAGLVFLSVIAVLGALGYAFVRPIVDQTSEFIDKLPQYVDDAKAGKGAVGRFVKDVKLDEWVEKNQERWRKGVTSFTKPALDVVRSIFNTVAAIVTVAVLTFLMLLNGPDLLEGAVGMLSPPRQRNVRRVANDAARAVSGYVAGNLLISLIAGVATYGFLWVAGVPFRGVLALWVAFADLIPLLGATLGAIPTIGVAFLASIPAGIATVIFYVVYQQFENHVLQTTIMARTVALRPLTVLVSVLAGVELFGLLGALLAIPVAGVFKVLGTEAIRWRRPDLAVITHVRGHHRAPGEARPLVQLAGRGWRRARRVLPSRRSKLSES